MNDKECLDARNTSVPLHEDNSVPIDKEIRILGRGYITKKQVSVLAECYGMRGITFHHIMEAFKTEKRNAQRRIKHFHKSKVLFTAQDLIDQEIELPPTFKNHIPQKYYATSMKADIIEKIKKEYRNVLLDTTGTPNSSYPLFPSLENQKANSLLEVLQLLHFSPTYIHKINLMLSIGRDNYKEISNFLHRPMGKEEEIIGKRHVEYVYHPNGTVQIFTRSNTHPVKLENDADVNIFFSLIGQIKDRMLYHIYDPRERIIPPINNWILKQCDINNDIRISDKAQLYIPDVQLKTAGKVFRMYVRSLNGNAVDRVEESKEVNAPLSSFNDLLKPDLNLLQKIENISEKIEKLSRMPTYHSFPPYAFSIF